ncbi:MAG: GNAT family N-acetyltransferase [Proteobacteria bacterium]|nr:GNAT family N-acetyltransferase [Pseudomonadota bacterium]
MDLNAEIEPVAATERWETLPITIRHAQNGDYEPLCPLFAELDTFHREARPELFQAPDGPVRSRKYLSDLIAGPNSTILVAERARELVGFAIVLLQDIRGVSVLIPRRVAVVENLAVAPAHRRRGVGRMLMRRALFWAKDHDARHLEVVVHEFNQGARGFYEQMGYRASTRRLMAEVA